ncbi:MAG: hypothetical protein KatS3mg111_1434 [Pirellulaceae bacterium]|nr:MAG: hypothetical protein KatS3mg111_1434 [Pirellulaceae bacterium]
MTRHNYTVGSSPEVDQRPTIPFSMPSEPHRVPVAAGDVLAIMMHAARRNRAWISDFADETIHVSADFYELLLAYRDMIDQSHRHAA